MNIKTISILLITSIILSCNHFVDNSGNGGMYFTKKITGNGDIISDKGMSPGSNQAVQLTVSADDGWMIKSWFIDDEQQFNKITTLQTETQYIELEANFELISDSVILSFYNIDGLGTTDKQFYFKIDNKGLTDISLSSLSFEDPDGNKIIEDTFSELNIAGYTEKTFVFNGSNSVDYSDYITKINITVNDSVVYITGSYIDQ